MRKPHTPGPWKLGPGRPIGIVGGGEMLVTVFGGDDTPSRGPSIVADVRDSTGLPNATLIAAAPDLLKIAKSFRAQHDKQMSLYGETTPCDCTFCEEIKPVIAKIEGPK